MSEENTDSIVVLNDEEGKEVSFEFLGQVDYEGDEYVVLSPIDEGDDEGTVIILKSEPCETEDDIEDLVSVEDDGVLNAVFEIFKDKFEDDYEFEN